MGRSAVVPSKTIKLHLNRIIFDQTCYPRHLDPKKFERRVAEFVVNMEAGAVFPPVVVVRRDDNSYVLIDGWHRLQAYSKLSHFEIACELLDIPESKFLEEAVRRNVAHGLALSVGDKARLIPRLKEQAFTTEQIAHLFHYTVTAVENIGLHAIDTSTGMEEAEVESMNGGRKKSVSFDADSEDWAYMARHAVEKCEHLLSTAKDWTGKPFHRQQMIMMVDALNAMLRIIRHKYKIYPEQEAKPLHREDES